MVLAADCSWTFPNDPPRFKLTYQLHSSILYHPRTSVRVHQIFRKEQIEQDYSCKGQFRTIQVIYHKFRIVETKNENPTFNHTVGCETSCSCTVNHFSYSTYSFAYLFLLEDGPKSLNSKHMCYFLWQMTDYLPYLRACLKSCRHKNAVKEEHHIIFNVEILRFCPFLNEWYFADILQTFWALSWHKAHTCTWHSGNAVIQFPHRQHGHEDNLVKLNIFSLITRWRKRKERSLAVQRW